MPKLTSLFTFLVSAFALVPFARTSVTFQNHDDLPLLRLPYGTWRAHHYNEDADVYKFRNIRYAAAPVGELRWSKPAPPPPVPRIQDGSYGHNCLPAPIPSSFESQIPDNITENAAEDCLFLDVYVPGKALKERKSSVPVVVWIHGGGYVTGSKDQAIEIGIYDGTSLIQRADNDLIIVSINYRLGAFGFLAGQPLQTNGTFNAGLHDQRAALQWVQSYIHLLGGDPENVSAWGQSAGAGSLIYHLVAEGGTLDPLFRRVLLQSPAFGTSTDPQVHYDRFEDFATAAGCPTKGEDTLRCLRAANSSSLRKANEEVYVGEPVPDGEYIRNTALVEYAEGNKWKPIESVLVSHVLDEGSLSVPSPVPPNFLQSVITGLLPPNSTSGIRKMVNLYETLYANATEQEMLRAMWTDLIYTCNIRAVLEAYPSPAWAFQYSLLDGVINATHGSDTVATWYSQELQGYTEPLFEKFQRYLTNFARTGDPNEPGSPEYELDYWPEVSGLEEEMPLGVLDLDNSGFGVIEDRQMLRGVCETWTGVLVDAVLGTEGSAGEV
ncbi:Alpha/Beta hydrolase protein [Aspergillus aurantiobrunneus]